MRINTTRKALIFLSLLLFFINHFTFLQAQVSHRDTVVSWRHFDYELDEFNGLESYSSTNIVEEQYPGVVLENEYVRLVILPEFGARILSYYYKPTGHEQFYLNPVGAPYGNGDGNFYYDWLMVMGGVFPTLSEPEHGKTWFLPWKWELIENGTDQISLTMEITDTIDYPYHPGKFNNGATEIKCISTVSLTSGKAGFELEHTLINPKNSTVPFEYWTCTTLAPGSQTGNTFTPENSEIIAPIDYIFLKDDWWSWMGSAEVPASGMGSHVFEYENLAFYANWEDMGIGYAHPYLEANYYGVINHENEVGVYRIADNLNITPGMKFWTWGASQGLNADPENFYENARPYIELWSGLSTQFFENAYISALDTITWTETYLPSIGLEFVNNVNESGTIYLDHIDDGSEKVLAKVFMSEPDMDYNLDIVLNGTSNYILLDEIITAEADNCTANTFSVEDLGIEDGDYIMTASVSDLSGNLLLESTLPISIPLPAYGIEEIQIEKPKLIRTGEFTYALDFKDPMKREIALFSMRGELVDIQQSNTTSVSLMVAQRAVYIIRVQENNISYTIKAVL